MEDKLKHLHSAMDETVFKDGEFTEENRDNVRQKIKKHHQRHSLNLFRRFELWFKPILSAAVCLLLFIGAIYVATHQGEETPEQPAHLNQQNDSASIGDKENHTETSQTSSPDELVNKIVRKAKEGKIINADFTSGQTTVEDVEKSWGSPDETSPPDENGIGIYITYKKRQAAFGYYDDSPIFDVRSYDKKLEAITLADIREIMGKADDIRNYEDDNHDQKILVYNVNNTYQLKWILKKPRKEKPNSPVDHISVYDKKAAAK